MDSRPTDEQLRGWLDWDSPISFPAYWESEHYDYLEAMFKEILESRKQILTLETDLQETVDALEIAQDAASSLEDTLKAVYESGVNG